MSWFSNSNKDFPVQTLAASTATKTAEEPRDILAENIRDNIKLFDNPNYTKVVRNVERKITPMFRPSKQPDMFEVSFSYCHEKLELEPGMHVALMPRHLVKPFLERMAVEVASNKVFDTRLHEIRNKVSAKMSDRFAKKAAEKAAENPEKKSA
jgi:hypothetical protein